MPSAYRGSVHRFQRQADGSEPGSLAREGMRAKERTEEDGVGKGELLRKVSPVDEGIKDVFSLIWSLQVADGQSTVSDGGKTKRRRSTAGLPQYLLPP